MRITVVCALLSAVSLALSLTGTFSGVLPADIAWVAIVLCGFPILLGAARGVILEHIHEKEVYLSKTEEIKPTITDTELNKIIKNYTGE